MTTIDHIGRHIEHSSVAKPSIAGGRPMARHCGSGLVDSRLDPGRTCRFPRGARHCGHRGNTMINDQIAG
jgi:hypothetical protein